MITFTDKRNHLEMTDDSRDDVFLIERGSVGLVKDEDLSVVNLYGFGRNNNSFLRGIKLAEVDPALGLADLTALYDYLLKRAEPVLTNGCVASASAIDTTRRTIWSDAGTNADPYRITAAQTVSISSSSAFDVGQQLTVKIGKDADGTLREEVVSLNGQTKVTLSGTWLGVGLIKIIGPATQGDIYVYKDGAITAGVPNTSTDIIQKIPAGEQFSAPGYLSVPTNMRVLVEYVSLSANDSDPISVQIEMNVAEQTYGWAPLVREFVVSSKELNFIRTPFELNPGFDYRFTAQAKTNSAISFFMNAAMVELRL